MIGEARDKHETPRLAEAVNLRLLCLLLASLVSLLPINVQAANMSERLAFITEWVDPSSNWLWQYQLFYYPASQEVEMVSCTGIPSLLQGHPKLP
jgi:hypothetical protein